MAEDVRLPAARRPHLVPDLWVGLLAVVVLGPALGAGLVLSYDMVWVPDLTLTRDALGVGSALPRAVPSDAVVAVLDEVVPGVVLQKLVLGGTLLAAGCGIVRLAGVSVVARLVAATAYLWNPFVAERLVMGHWPVLVGYAVAPWVVLAVRSWGRAGRPPARLWWLLPVGSLSASTGIVLGVLVCVLVVALRVRRPAYAVALLLLANAPWLVAGVLHAGSATSRTTTAAAAAVRFALHDEGSVPGPLAALTLGGIWNSEVVPEGRGGLAGWLALVLLVPLAAAGTAGLRRHLGPRLAGALLGCAALGWAFASLTWWVPEVTGQLAAVVPGGGVLRDSSRLLALGAPVLALLLGHGSARLLRALPGPARWGGGVAVLLLPVALLPGAAWGVGGQLGGTDYPADYVVARTLTQQAQDRDLGDVVLLPFSSYRQPAWNEGRKVLDPTGRYLGTDFVADDALRIDGQRLPGEDDRAAAVARALELPTPRARADALRAEGVGLVAAQPSSGEGPEVAGEVLHDGPDLRLVALGPASPPEPPVAWWVAMALAWVAYVGSLLGGGVVGLVQTWRRGSS